MPKLNMTVPHHLGEDEAIKRVKHLLEDFKTRFADQINDLHEEWNGDKGSFRFSAMGYSVSGTLTVKKSELEISGDLPFAALMFKGKIESWIKERAKTLLA